MLVRATRLLVEAARRYEKVERGLKGELRLVGHRLPAIPARRAERTGWIVETIEYSGEGLVGGGSEWRGIHLVRFWVIQFTVTLDTLAETIDTLEVGLHVSAPLALYPRISAFLDADGCVHRKGCGAICRRRIDIIAESITCDTGIVDLVKVVKLRARKRLLFHGQGHLFLLSDINVCGVSFCDARLRVF